MKKILIIALLSVFLNSCAAAYTIPEERFFRELPENTKATLKRDSENCSIVNPKELYFKPCAFTKQKDLKKLAKFIDESVEISEGNAYQIKSYRWVEIDMRGMRHFEVYFEVLKCE